MHGTGEPRAPRRLVDAAAVLALVLLGLWAAAPLFADPRAMGFQDWDVQAAYRYVTVLAWRDHHQLPAWNPWFCGGFPAWGYAEGASNLVSPFAPLYFALAFPLALRVEAVAAFVVGVAGTYLLAGRFTHSPGWRAFVAAIWMLNSRFWLQIASGHMWHLAYAWTPFALYFLDRAVRERRLGLAAAAGAFLALTIYVGGIYPFPHTAMLMGVYALVIALATRDRRPLVALAVAAAVAVGLAAPKLFPVLVTLGRFPRSIGSNEPITLHDLWVMLTARDQSFQGHPLLQISYSWVWWEWGIYVGVAGALALAAGVLVGRGPALAALRVCGLGCLLLGLGGSVWSSLHALPFFRSQHIPSRLFYPGVLMLALALAGGLARPWRRLAGRWRWAEPALLVLVALFAWDMAAVARQGTAAPFHLQVPAVERRDAFEQEGVPRFAYGKPRVAERRLAERYDWPAKIVYPSMLANLGVVRCYGVPPEVRSAVIGREQPGYRGLVFVADGPGRAEIVRFSPNAVRVRVSGARAGDLLVYDMNDDPGWRAGGARARSWRGLVAAPLAAGDQTVELSYRPAGLNGGLALFALTALALGGAGVAAWRRRKRAAGATGGVS